MRALMIGLVGLVTFPLSYTGMAAVEPISSVEIIQRWQIQLPRFALLHLGC